MENDKVTEKNLTGAQYFKLPANLKRKFKAICLMRDKSASEVLVELVEKYVEDNKDVLQL
jgi:predicted DNA-binding protein